MQHQLEQPLILYKSNDYHPEHGDSRGNRSQPQYKSNREHEAESETLIRDRTNFNCHLREAMHRVRIGPDKIEECILDGSTPFVNNIMTTLIPSKFKVPPLDQYSGTGDPIAHVSMFRTKMML